VLDQAEQVASVAVQVAKGEQTTHSTRALPRTLLLTDGLRRPDPHA
jgi:hypothetical protein